MLSLSPENAYARYYIDFDFTILIPPFSGKKSEIIYPPAQKEYEGLSIFFVLGYTHEDFD
jgi:hypothetical protein